MKTPSEINRHSELVECAFDRYGDVLIKVAADLFNPDHPAFYRTMLRCDQHVDAAKIKRDLQERIQQHDQDKAHIVEAYRDPNLSNNARKRLEAAYAMHDLKSDHHAACWCINPRKLQVVSFLEHLIDHAAVNLGKGLPPFDSDFLLTGGAFIAKRTEVRGVPMNDIEAVLNLGNPLVMYNFLSAKNIYRQWVLRFIDTLQIINGVAR